MPKFANLFYSLVESPCNDFSSLRINVQINLVSEARTVTVVALYLLDSMGMVITCEQCGQTTYHTVRIPVACTKHWHLDHSRSHHTLLSRYIQHTILHVQHMHCLGQLTALLLLSRNLYMHMNNNNELYSITNASHAL